ncbi:MAG: N-acetylmuramoyl-L-alanine amidase [Myxococcota bacterium]
MQVVLALVLAAAPLPLVVVDAGHGGAQDGAIGVCGAKEKDVTLGISTEIGRVLAASGKTRVLLTRTDDATMDLKERARFANDAGADLFISVHANSGPQPRSHGVETYFLSRTMSDRRIAKLVARENETFKVDVSRDETTRILDNLSLSAAHVESARFAERTHGMLTRELGLPGRRGVLQAPFFVLLAARMPSVLIETGFLTNKDECKQLASAEHRERLAKVIAGAVLLHVAQEELAVAKPAGR